MTTDYKFIKGQKPYQSNQFVNVHVSISLSKIIDTDFQYCLKSKSFFSKTAAIESVI